MATVSGNLGVVKIGGNQVAEIKSFDITETDNIIEDTGMGDSFKSFVSGIKEASGTITCHFDRTDSYRTRGYDSWSKCNIRSISRRWTIW